MLKTNFQNDVKYQTAPKWPRKLQMINQCSHPPDGFFGGFLNRWFHIASTCQSTFLHQKGQAVPDPQTCRIISWRCDTLYLFHTNKTDTHKNFFSHKTNKKLSLSPHPIAISSPISPTDSLAFCHFSVGLFWFQPSHDRKTSRHLPPTCSVILWSSEKLPIRNSWKLEFDFKHLIHINMISLQVETRAHIWYKFWQ